MSTATAFDPATQPMRQILDQSGAIVFVKDLGGRYLFVNGEFEGVAGLSMDTVIGRRDEELFPAELALRLRHNDLRVIHERRTLRFEETGDFAGKQRTFLTAKFPLLAPDGEPYAVCGIATDITDRKNLEEAFRRSALAVSSNEGDAVYRELVRALATLLGADGAFIAVPSETDPSRLTMLALLIDGTLRESFEYPLVGTPCETVVGQQYRHYPSRLIEQFPLDADFRAIGIDSYAGYPLQDASGRPLGLIAVISRLPLPNPVLIESILKIFSVRAVSEIERQRSYRSLQASEANYRAIFAATEDAVFIHDFDTGAIIDANPQACRAYGYERSELLRLRVGDISSGVPPYTEEQGLRYIAEARVRGTVRFEWHRRNRDGRLRWDDVCLKRAEIHGRPVILAFTRDITERMELEAQLRQAQKMEAIGQLAGGIAHDFNNLLTSMLGYVVMAREHLELRGETTAAGFLDQAQLSCERARDLIQQMLTFSRGGRGAPRVLELQTLVARTLKLLRASVPSSIELRSRFDSSPDSILADPVHVEQVLINLCLNARDAIGASGAITVSVSTQEVVEICSSCRRSTAGKRVVLEVSDDGEGIPAEVLDRIFEPFFTTKAVGKGSGMGLSMVHGIVHEQGGHVLVRSQPGSGTRFQVLLPPLDGTVPEDRTPVSLPGAARQTGPLARLGGRALIVDDEPAVVRYMSDLLGSWGIGVSQAGDGDSALQMILAGESRFDVIITDQTMPSMSGLELAARIRERHATIPILLFSGFSDSIETSRLSAAGITAFFRKPVDAGALHGMLAGILAQGA